LHRFSAQEFTAFGRTRDRFNDLWGMPLMTMTIIE
jgi:hypothetical protein